VNTAINDSPEMVNKDPYGTGWLLKIEMTNPAEVKSNTMPVAEYKALIGQ
jgi:glycine cleavage system H protein